MSLSRSGVQQQLPCETGLLGFLLFVAMHFGCLKASMVQHSLVFCNALMLA